MDNIYDVVIIGAGCAGLNLAQKLGEFGLRVCLVDSRINLLNVPFHTLGSFLNLKEVGLPESVVAEKITECSFYSKNRHFTKKASSKILNKMRIHEELLKRAIDNNVAIKASTTIVSAEFGAGGMLNLVKDENGKVYKASVFVDASGAHGFLSKRIGLQDKKLKLAEGVEYNVKYFGPEHRAYLFIGSAFSGGYGWIFPVGNGRAIVGYGTFNKKMFDQLKQKLDGMVSSSPVKELVQKDNDKFNGYSLPVTSVKNKFVSKNIVCVGDSVSQVNPLVGEGYRFILKSGLIAAKYVQQAIANKNLELLKGYEVEWNEKFYSIYKKSKKLQRLANLASKSDLLCDMATWIMSKWPDEKFERALAADFKNKL